MIRLRIDRIEVEIETGATVLQAAEKANIYIPTLCAHPMLSPFGACRLCIVEIEGLKGYPTSCTTPVQDGMIVRTDTERIRQLRRGIMELILLEHPCGCLVCEKRKDCEKFEACIRGLAVTTGCKYCPKDLRCELQRLFEALSIDGANLPYCYRGLSVQREDPFFDRDYNLCVLCGRCVRVCQELKGAGTLTFLYRGPKTIVGTAFERPHVDSGCQFCGACVDICPTGALSDRLAKWQGVPESVVQTICPYCGAGCKIQLELKEGRVIRSIPENNIQICDRGRFGIFSLIYNPARLLRPLIKRNGTLKEVSWEEALDYVAERLKDYKGESFGMLVSPYLTNEDLYISKRFTGEIMGSENIGSFYKPLELGPIPSPPGKAHDFRDVKNILVIGGVPPALVPQIKYASLRGANLIIVDPEMTGICRFAKVYVQLTPYSQDKFVIALLSCLAKRGIPDIPEEIKTKLGDFNLAKLVGVKQTILREIAEILMEGKVAILVSAEKVSPSLITILSRALSAKLMLFLPKCNTYGQLQIFPNLLKYTKILGDDRIKVLFSLGEPILNPGKKFEFLVVQDPYPERLSNRADVYLPSATFAEIEGTYTDMFGTIQRINRAILPLGDSKPDWWIISQLAKRLGTDFEYKDAPQIASELSCTFSQVSGYGTDKENNLKALLNLSLSPVKKRKGYPFLLCITDPGYSYRGFNLSELTKGFQRIKDHRLVMINTKDAKILSLKDGDIISISSQHGKVKRVAKFTDNIPQGVLLVHFDHLEEPISELLSTPEINRPIFVKIGDV